MSKAGVRNSSLTVDVATEPKERQKRECGP